MIYTTGQKRLSEALSPVPLDAFLNEYEELYRTVPKIKGTALFLQEIYRKSLLI